MSSPPVEYIELHMSNFTNDDVAQLNEWGIWAADEIERLRTTIGKLEGADPISRCKVIDELLAEYKYWRDVEGDDDLIPIAMGAIGAVSNVLVRLTGATKR